VGETLPQGDGVHETDQLTLMLLVPVGTVAVKCATALGSTEELSTKTEI